MNVEIADDLTLQELQDFYDKNKHVIKNMIIDDKKHEIKNTKKISYYCKSCEHFRDEKQTKCAICGNSDFIEVNLNEIYYKERGKKK